MLIAFHLLIWVSWICFPAILNEHVVFLLTKYLEHSLTFNIASLCLVCFFSTDSYLDSKIIDFYKYLMHWEFFFILKDLKLLALQLTNLIPKLFLHFLGNLCCISDHNYKCVSVLLIFKCPIITNLLGVHYNDARFRKLLLISCVMHLMVLVMSQTACPVQKLPVLLAFLFSLSIPLLYMPNFRNTLG